jgi:GNAT superfamily N-acetyltransferase
MIREATLSDISTIHDMIVELAVYEKEPDAVIATPADLERALFGDNPALFAHVADDPEHGVVGFTLWFLNYSTWLGKHGVYLEDLYVMPEHRGSGYGIALLSNLAQICVDRGYGRLEWWVLDSPHMSPSWEFYESQGAMPLREWVPHRVTGEALQQLAHRPTGLAVHKNDGENGPNAALPARC